MYQELAKYYQELVDVKAGSQFFYELLLKYKTGNHILDCACGSGELVSLLIKQGFNAKGFDLSLEMINKSDVSYLLTHQNMISFKYNETFDMICCFCDSFNYLLDKNSVIMFIKNVHKHLKKQGVFIFDMHNYDTLKVFQEEYYQTGLINTIPYQWSIITENDLLLHTFIFDEIKEEHIQKVYSLEVITQILKEIGFNVQVLNEKELNGYENEKEVIVATKI